MPPKPVSITTLFSWPLREGRWQRPLHAGFLGQDALFIHEETHLTPAFGRLPRAVADYASGGVRPVQILEMTATRREGVPALALNADDGADPRIQRRAQAAKQLHLIREGTNEVPAKASAKQALDSHEGSGWSVVLYVNGVEDAGAAARELTKQTGQSADRVRLLTGTLRGHERVWLVTEAPVFARSWSDRSPEETTAYLVATAAGEVGIDLNADAADLDSVPLDRLIQRLGQVNRTGGRAAQLSLMAPDKPQASVLKATLDALAELSVNSEGSWAASPAALSALLRNREGTKALSEVPPIFPFYPPIILPLQPPLLDLWRLAGLADLDASPVAPWLHGQAEATEPPDTWLVWRPLWSLNPTEDPHWLIVSPVRASERVRLPIGWAQSLSRLFPPITAIPGRQPSGRGPQI